MDKITSKDIFTNSFLAMQSSVSGSSIIEILVSLFASFLLGSFIFFLYKKTFQGVLYQRSFNVSLIVTTMVLTLIIMIIKGNLVLSLGMVGALSIVRFRTPIKDPVDLVFIFWAIAVGIANGVGFFHISFIGSAAIAAVLFLISKRSEIDNDSAYMLVIKMKDQGNHEKELVGKIKNMVKAIHLKSKTITSGYCEVIFEVRIVGGDTSFMNKLYEDGNVDQASLLTYSGELS